LTEARRVPCLPALRVLGDLVAKPAVEVVWVDSVLHAEAMGPLCDAVSFVLMLGRGITKALTTDHRLAQAGFQRLLEL
jgi:predicted nucleic acid-binding protein